VRRKKGDVHYTINPKVIDEINFRPIIDTLARSLKMKRNGALVSLLRNTEFDGRYFRFTYFESDSWKVYVLCPKCNERKLKLFKLDDEYACERCQHISRPHRRMTPRVSQIYARYVRPLKLLREIEDKLLDPEKKLTDRQRSILENKAATIRKALPDYVESLRDEIIAKLGD
jgi:DNA-directed RNA polymerase subunit RPC12/RpoP